MTGTTSNDVGCRGSGDSTVEVGMIHKLNEYTNTGETPE